MKHTPGPYWYQPAAMGKAYMVMAEDTQIAEVFGAHWGGTPKDNARLLAAAPELLDVLRSAHFQSWVHNAAITNDIEDLRRICLDYCNWWNNQAMPAIAKAEGGE